jgi:N-acetylmuramoyl-L-alanine amidase
MLSIAFAPLPPNMVVVIDAGHGGSDPGNLGTGRFGSTEKNVTLDVALRLRDYITERFPDVKIVMTRTSDAYPSLKSRVRMANESEADLFISIHCDAFTSPNAIGSSTFVMGMHKSEESLRVAMQENASIYQEEDYQNKYEGFDPSDPDTYIALSLRQSVFLNKSLELGSLIQGQFKERVGRKDRGVRQAGYYVISFTQMPSVLVELGFLSNPTEEEFLNSEAGKELMASALLRAFRSYKEKHHPSGVDLLADPITTTQSNAAVEEANPTNLSISNLTSPTFRVQILASEIRLPKEDPRFSGLAPVVEYLRNGLYKYAVGAAPTMQEAQLLKESMRNGDFPDAFVVKFEGTSLEHQDVVSIKGN